MGASPYPTRNTLVSQGGAKVQHIYDRHRTYYSSGTSFVYDTEAPKINILSGLSLGLLNQTTILSCDFCELKWSVDDLGRPFDSFRGAMRSSSERFPIHHLRKTDLFEEAQVVRKLNN